MKSDEKSVPYDALEKLFHEPNRLAIMSALCAAERGMSFGALKEQCALTDGNLSRHLSALEKARAIRIEKKFVKKKPRTTVSISAPGLARFSDYLTALNDVLLAAQSALGKDAAVAPLPAGRRQTA